MSLAKLYYFAAPARAEFIRLMLEDAKSPYEFVKMTWGEQATFEKAPFRQLPIWEEPDGFVIAQTGTIVRYVAKKLNLYPGDPKEAAHCGI
jgi:glutathione S-transferase